MIEARQLSVGQHGRLLHRLDFAWPRARARLVLGPNGSGKTTLLRCLLGLRPFQGDLLWQGKALDRMSHLERARLFGYVPQTLETDFPLRAIDLVASGRFPFAESHQQSLEQARIMMHRTRTLALAQRSIATLSGGELQRVVLAGALAQEPAMLLLDEPANHLDPYNRQQLVDLLLELLQQGLGLVIVSHEWRLFSALNPACFCLKAGRLFACGELEEITPRLDDLYRPCPAAEESAAEESHETNR
jgi:iron complex transport system ATP-binding protein